MNTKDSYSSNSNNDLFKNNFLSNENEISFIYLQQSASDFYFAPKCMNCDELSR